MTLPSILNLACVVALWISQWFSSALESYNAFPIFGACVINITIITIIY